MKEMSVVSVKPFHQERKWPLCIATTSEVAQKQCNGSVWWHDIAKVVVLYSVNKIATDGGLLDRKIIEK